MAIRAIWKWLLILAVCTSVCSSVWAAGPVVETESGLLEGTALAGVDRFMGVPYAAPPLGSFRWRAPQPMAPWDGVREAKQPGSACLQIGNFYTSNDESTFDRPYGSEDCLFLNLWAPPRSDTPRPVLVFFHGGSGIYGDSAHPMYDAERLARETDAVVVTANFMTLVSPSPPSLS